MRFCGEGISFMATLICLSYGFLPQFPFISLCFFVGYFLGLQGFVLIATLEYSGLFDGIDR